MAGMFGLLKLNIQYVTKCRVETAYLLLELSEYFFILIFS